MTCSRIRISLGQWLIVVAVLALDLMVILRRREIAGGLLYPTHCWFESYVVGLLPLTSVTLLGVLPFFRRSWRKSRPGTGVESGSASTWVGCWFLNLHFLVLGSLAILFRPNWMQDASMLYSRTLNELSYRPEMEWLRPYVFDWVLFWELLDVAVLGLAISGPPLLLSWIGGTLARRCSSTLPQYRFRILAGLVSLGFALIGLTIAFLPQSCVESRDVEFNVVIVDRDSGQPITSAFARIEDIRLYERTLISPSDFTDPDGRVSLVKGFLVIGERNAFRTQGDFSPWGRWLEVSADRYQTVRIPLTDVLGHFVDIENPRARKVELVKGQTPPNPCQDIAGRYSGGRGFEILADGRFRLFPPQGLTHCWDYEFGYVKRDRDEIRFVGIPQAPATGFDMTSTWCIVEWGDRHYLSSTRTDALMNFCRATLRPIESPFEFDWRYGGYLRESDREKLQRGLPRLPARIWLWFLLDEIQLRNREGILRNALASLIPKSPLSVVVQEFQE